MTARLTAAEARALSLDATTTRKRTRRTASGPYHSTCHTCGETFESQAAETRHVEQVHPARFDLKIEMEP